MKKLIWGNLLALSAALLAIEAIGQLYHRSTTGVFLPAAYQQHLRDAQDVGTVFERHPYLVARPKRSISVSRGQATISTTPINTRVTGPAPATAGATTVAVVGGSTVFGTKVTDADTWPWLLREKLGERFDVINYGVPGYTTAEALIQMTLLVPESRPAVVIFLQGWNDLRNSHWPGFQADYYSHGMTQFDTLIPPLQERNDFWTTARHYSFLLGLLHAATGTRVAALAAASDGGQVSSDPDPDVERIYVRNLRTLKTLTTQIGATAIFVPQVLNEENYSRTGVSRSWTPYVEDAAVPRLMRRLNDLMSDVCGASEERCQFVSEALVERWDGNDFVDEGHFSRRGGEKLAAMLSRRIARP